jgi:Helix-turn-helix domain of resolvase
VLTLRDSGMPVADIMEATGLGRTTVFAILRQAREQGE